MIMSMSRSDILVNCLAKLKEFVSIFLGDGRVEVFNVDDSKSVLIFMLNVGVPVDYGGRDFLLVQSGFFSGGIMSMFPSISLLMSSISLLVGLISLHVGLFWVVYVLI